MNDICTQRASTSNNVLSLVIFYLFRQYRDSLWLSYNFSFAFVIDTELSEFFIENMCSSIDLFGCNKGLLSCHVAINEAFCSFLAIFLLQ